MTREPRRLARVLGVSVRLSLCASVVSCRTSRTPEPGEASSGLALQPVATGLESPLHLVSPPADRRLFVVEQAGRIRVIRDGRLLGRPYLDLTDRVGSGGERGLLSLAFHPRFAVNGRFYVNYTDRRGDTHVSRFTADPAADTAGAGTESLVLFVRQPYANHNGGHVLFGPDGMLYVGMGDGGAAGDPQGNAQDLGALLGKLLRLDVEVDSGYSVPPDNPFAGRPGARAEIWAYGLRNPWRMAFDIASQTLYIADVGQNQWEEVNAVPDTARGLDYGWRALEGSHCFLLPVCRSAGSVGPVFEYGHDLGCSITGGVVYRGRRVPQIAGQYLFSDYCGGWLRSFRLANGHSTEVRVWNVPSPGPVMSFGEDSEGEVYVLSATGTVYRIVGATTTP